MQLIHIAPYLPYRLKAINITGQDGYTIGNKPAKIIEIITLGNFYGLSKIGYVPLLKPIEDMPIMNTSNMYMQLKIFEQHYDVFDLISKGLAFDNNLIP